MKRILDFVKYNVSYREVFFFFSTYFEFSVRIFSAQVLSVNDNNKIL